MTKHKNNKESGIVSILTVLFLTILLSVLTVAFLRVMNDEQVQTIDDDLTKSAYSSALTGVEDAKRALEYCYSQASAAEQASCFSALENSNCPGAITAGTPLTTGSNPVLDSNGQVGGRPELNQRYSCLLVSRITENYKGKDLTNIPRLIELAPNGNSFQRVVVRWHSLVGEAADGLAAFAPGATSNNPRNSNWRDGSTQAVAMLRAQVIGFEAEALGGVELDELDDSTAAAFFVPNPSSTTSSLGQLNADTGTNWYFNAGKRQLVACTNNQTVNNGYSCQITIDFGRALDTQASGSQKNRYYLLLSTLYNQADFEIELQTGSGNRVNFFGVQTQVDVTGVAADVFRRIQSRIEFENGWTAKDAIQTGASLCKGFYVTSERVRMLRWNAADNVYEASEDRLASGAQCSGFTLDSGAEYPVIDP